MTTKQLKAVVFDLDDTLIDWSGFDGEWVEHEAYHLGGVLDYICEHHPLDDLQAFAAEFRMRSLEAWTESRTSHRAPNLGSVLVSAAVSLGVPDDVLDARRCLEAYRWRAVPGTLLFPEVNDTLRVLQTAGVRLGIITNAYQEMWMRDVELAQLGIDVHEFFPDCRFSAADFGYLKPHPAIFQAALDCLGVEPAQMVYVGDDLRADVFGSKSVGIFAVLRNSRPDQAEPENMVAPDAVLESLTELPAILDDAFPGWRS